MTARETARVPAKARLVIRDAIHEAIRTSHTLYVPADELTEAVVAGIETGGWRVVPAPKEADRG